MQYKTNKHLSSPQNPLVKQLKSLTQSQGIKKHHQALIMGSKIVKEAYENVKIHIHYILCSHKDELHGIPEVLHEKVLFLSTALFNEMDTLGTHSPLLVVETPETPLFDPNTPPQGLEILCAINDPNNLGALIRSATAFEAQKIILLKECCQPFLPKVTRSSCGMNMTLPLEVGPSIHDLDIPMTALDLRGEPLSSYQWPQNVRLIIGEEGPGVPHKLKATRITIPMNSKVESLNVTVAASLALFSYHSQKKKFS